MDRTTAADAVLLGGGAVALGALSAAWVIAFLLRAGARHEARAYAQRLTGDTT